MKWINWNRGKDVAEDIRNRVKHEIETWWRRVNSRFQKWSSHVRPRRLRLYVIVAGMLAVSGNAALLVRGLKSSAWPSMDNVVAPVGVCDEPAMARETARRRVRSRLELQHLVDSLQRDSTGREILEILIRDNGVKLDSALLQEGR